MSRKRKGAEGDGSATCINCGARLCVDAAAAAAAAAADAAAAAADRLAAGAAGETNRRSSFFRGSLPSPAPALAGCCSDCVCRCILCGEVVLKSMTELTFPDEILLVMVAELRCGAGNSDGEKMISRVGVGISPDAWHLTLGAADNPVHLCTMPCRAKLRRRKRMAKRRGITGAQDAASSLGGQDVGVETSALLALEAASAVNVSGQSGDAAATAQDMDLNY